MANLLVAIRSKYAHVLCQVHMPNLNHIGLWIDDLDSCVTWLQHKGVRFAGEGALGGGMSRNDFACCAEPMPIKQLLLQTKRVCLVKGW